MNQQQLESDLNYVREAVQRSDAPKSPPSIYYYWAVASLIGVAYGTWSADIAGHLILLILSLTYFLAGIHLDRSLLWVSAMMVAGYLALFFLNGPVWTVTGVAVALGLVLTPWLEGRGDDNK